MEPLLSVCLITYNHVNYIEQAIEGVLMQKTNFAFELIIADDYSTDGTRDIIKNYKKKYPDLIKLILQKKNVGAAQNWIDLLNNPKTKYIAYFEGDDYWTDPYKLQKQVDCLEFKKHCIGCFSDTSVISDKGVFLQDVNFDTFKREISITEVGSFWMPTVSVCFRRNYLQPVINSKRIRDVYNGDMFLYYLMSQFGNYIYVNTAPSCYRQHPGGIWSGLKVINQYEKNQVSNYIIYDELLPEFKNVLIERIRQNYTWQLNYLRDIEHITYIFKFLKNNFQELFKRKLFKETLHLLRITFPVLVHRVNLRLKRIFQH
jgi:glycosyltransferase involved in cell wall biosynthesis